MPSTAAMRNQAEQAASMFGLVLDRLRARIDYTTLITVPAGGPARIALTFDGHALAVLADKLEDVRRDADRFRNGVKPTGRAIEWKTGRRNEEGSAGPVRFSVSWAGSGQYSAWADVDEIRDQLRAAAPYPDQAAAQAACQAAFDAYVLSLLP